MIIKRLTRPDVDQNGYLGAPDLLKCFRAMGQDLEDNLVDSMLSQVVSCSCQLV